MFIVSTRKENAMKVFRLVSILLVASFVLAACGGKSPAAVPPTATPAASTPLPPATGQAVRVGILVIRSAVATNEQYGPLMSYLTSAVGRPFTIVPLDFDGQFREVEQGSIEFVFTNPLAATQLRRLYHVSFLTTLSRPKTGTKFSGIILVRKDSGIQTVKDLYGKRAACVDFETAAAGCIFQVYHLLQKGFDSFKDFSSFTEIPSQDNIVLAVLNGTIDVGFVRTGQVEDMIKAGTLTDDTELAIFDQASDDFFYPHTTALYPEWPFAALAGTDPALAEAVKSALLNIPSDHPALTAAKLTGFVPPEDYSSLDALIETLKLPTWDATP